MGLDYFLNKYIVIERKDGKKVTGILVDILNSSETEENMGFISLVVRVNDNKFKNIHLVEVENIGEVL